MQILPICGLSTCRQAAKVMRENKHRKRTQRAGGHTNCYRLALLMSKWGL